MKIQKRNIAISLIEMQKHNLFTQHLLPIAILCWFLCVLPFTLQGQPIEIEPNTISTTQGLASRKVKHTFQDSYGWIWISTDISLHRYDGYKVERMDETLNINIDQTVRSAPLIWEDGDKNIWINNFNEVVKYDPLTNSTKRYSFQHDGGKIDTVLYALIDHKGRFLLKPKNGNIRVYTHSKFEEIPKTQDGVFNAHEEDHLTSMALGHPSGYVLRSSRYHSHLLNDQFKPYRSFSRDQFPPSKGLNEFGFTINVSPKGTIYGEVKYDYFYVYNDTLEAFQRPTFLEDFPVKCKIGFVNNGEKILFSSEGKVWEFNYSNNKLKALEFYTQDRQTLTINDIMIDATGGIWISTNFGAKVLNSNQNRFESIRVNNPLEVSYPNSIRAITNLSDHVLLISAKFSNFKYDLKADTLIRIPGYKNNIWSAVWADSSLWGVRLGTNGLLKWNPQKDTFDLIPFPVDAYLPIAIDYSEGTIWTGDGPLIIKYKIGTDIWSYHDWNYGRVNDFYFESPNSIFLACDEGFIHVDSNLNALHILSKVTHPNLSSHKIQNIYQDIEGKFWLSTKGGGVCVYDIQLDSVRTIDISSGLPNNTVYAVIPNGEKYWMPTDNGLALYDIKTENINTFYTQHGLSHNEFNFPSHFEYNDKLYLGTLDGVTVVDKRSNYLSDLKPSLFVTSISTYDQQNKGQENHLLCLDDQNPLVMGVSESNLKISFSLADYTNPKENRFAYLIEGFEEEWNHLGNSHILTIGSLPPGEYEIKLIGYTNSGVSTDKIISLPILVQRPFTQSWSFYILLVLGLASFYYLLYRFRLFQLNKINDVRQRIAANLHDEVGSVMTHIALESDLLQAKLYDANEVDTKLAEIATNSREASVMMSDIVWSFDSHQDKTKNLVDRIRQYLHKMLSARDIQFYFNAGSVNMNKDLHPDVRQNIYLIFKEAIHNIVKHSNCDKVNIDLEQKGKLIILTIKDNGNGRMISNSSSSGQGLRNMHKRADRIAGHLKVEKQNGYTVSLEVNIN